MVRGIEVTPSNFKETVLDIRKDFIMRYEALKKQFDAELESYRRDPTQNISEIVQSQLKRLGGLMDRTSYDYGTCFDEAGFTKKHSPTVYKATINLVDEIIGETEKYLTMEHGSKVDSLPAHIHTNSNCAFVAGNFVTNDCNNCGMCASACIYNKVLDMAYKHDSIKPKIAKSIADLFGLPYINKKEYSEFAKLLRQHKRQNIKKVIYKNSGKHEISPQACAACGACRSKCPAGAIQCR